VEIWRGVEMRGGVEVRGLSLGSEFRFEGGGVW
jgi:hypothetical protein